MLQELLVFPVHIAEKKQFGPFCRKNVTRFTCTDLKVLDGVTVVVLRGCDGYDAAHLGARHLLRVVPRGREEQAQRHQAGHLVSELRRRVLTHELVIALVQTLGQQHLQQMMTLA